MKITVDGADDLGSRKLVLYVDDSLGEQVVVAMKALNKMHERNSKRKGVWKNSGLKGQVFHLFAKAERAFTRAQNDELPDQDDFIDLINYAIFAELLRRKADLNGSWPWTRR